VLGLLVNLASAWILHDTGHDHDHDHEQHHHDHADHGHGHTHAHQDHNLRSAYFHVLTDALTSVLAIVALLSGRFYGWWWMDPLMGIVGGIVIARWSWGLLRGAGAVLLATVPDSGLAERILRALEQEDDRVTDLHVWRIGPGHLAVIASVVSDQPRAPNHYKARLAEWPQLSHITVEVQPCLHPPRPSDPMIASASSPTA
jgi:cation diffusion facilitator family transporter